MMQEGRMKYPSGEGGERERNPFTRGLLVPLFKSVLLPCVLLGLSQVPWTGVERGEARDRQ